METQTPTMAAQYAAKLRAVADWFEDHPDAPAPTFFSVDVFLPTRAALTAAARAIGSAEKVHAGEWFYLRVTVAETLIDFNVSRTEVCERRVVGTREIPRTVTEAHTEDIVEWECRSIFAEDES